MDKYASDDIIDRLMDLKKWVRDLQTYTVDISAGLRKAVEIVDELRMRSSEDNEGAFMDAIEAIKKAQDKLEDI